MKKEDLWAIYVRKNPEFDSDGNVTMSAKGLKKLFEQTWDVGNREGFNNGRAWGKTEAERKAKNEDVGGIFKKYFGGK